MSLQKSLIIFVAALAVATSQNIYGVPSELSQSNILPLSAAEPKANPDQTMACFNYYVPLISEIAQTYQYELDNCTQAAQTATLSAENATAAQRDALAQSVNASFAALTECQEAESVQDIFQCYIIEGSAGAKSLYGVSTNATLQLAALNETLRRIQSEESLCETQAKVTYEKDSEQAYEDFNRCMLGLSQVPTTTEASSTSDVDTSSSAAPSSSTTASSKQTTINITEDLDIKPEEDLFKFSPRFNYVRA